jgi:hypothetical protein
MEDYAWLCINARIGNALISACAVGARSPLDAQITQVCADQNRRRYAQSAAPNGGSRSL